MSSLHEIESQQNTIADLTRKHAKQQVSAVLIALLTISSLLTASVALVNTTNTETTPECIHMSLEPNCVLTRCPRSTEVRCDTIELQVSVESFDNFTDITCWTHSVNISCWLRQGRASLVFSAEECGTICKAFATSFE